LFNQDENFRIAILKKRARIEEINLILARPRPNGNTGGLSRLIEERLHLEQAVAELDNERRRLQLQGANALFRWDDIDHRLLSPKTNNLAEDMHKRIAEAKRRVHFETAQSGNSAGYLPRLFSSEEQLTDEWAEKLYAAYCETWTQQNRAICAAFIRAVRDRAIAQLFAARKSSVHHEVLLRARRINEQVNSVALSAWSMSMDRLMTRWNRKLEVEAVAAEYRAATPSEATRRSFVLPEAVLADEPISVQPSHAWRVFHETFKALADEELRLEPQNRIAFDLEDRA
jgi:hypothetical protein